MKRFLIPLALLAIPAVALAGQALGETGDFTYQRLVTIVTELVQILLEIAGLAAVAFVVYYGLRMALSRGDPAAFNTAKKGLLLSFVGALVIFGVFTIIASVQRAVQSVGE